MTSPRRWVWHLQDPLPDEPPSATRLLGAKGAGLQRITAAGLEVPPGFVITTDACGERAASEDLPDAVWQQVTAGVTRLEGETGRRFGSGAEPLLLAVRSGAAVSMPGVLVTLLNCGLNLRLAVTQAQRSAYARFIAALAAAERDLRLDATDEPGEPVEDGTRCERYLERYQQCAGEPFPQDVWEQLRRSVRAVLDSWSRPRAVAYRRLRGLSDTPGTAVVVQAMFPSDVSGVLFTREPRSGDADCMLVEAVRGLGDQLVSGWATPQRYSIRRRQEDPRLEARGESSQPHDELLTAEQLSALGRLGLRLESEFGGAVDVEWGWAAGRFAILQARRVDGGDDRRARDEARAAEIRRLAELAAGRHTLWVRHNLSEGLPLPTPLTWDIVRGFMRGSGGFGRLYRDLGYAPSRTVCDQGFLELVCGRIYADCQRLPDLFCAGLPLGYDFEAVRADPSLIDRAPTAFDPQRTDAWFLLRLPRLVWVLWRAGRRLRRAGRSAASRFEQQALPPFLEYVRRERQRELAELDDRQLIDVLHQRIDNVLHGFAPEALRPALIGSLAFASLDEQLRQLLGDDEGGQLARRLVGRLEMDPELDQDGWLLRVALGRGTLDEFLERFGHRAAGEMELAVPRWREDRAGVEQLLGWLVAAPAEDADQRRQSAEAARGAARDELYRRLCEEGASSLRARVERDLSLASRLIPFREIGKHYLMMGYELIRQATERWARRSGLDGDTYFLQLDELARRPCDAAALRRLAQSRREQWRVLQQIAVPDVIDSRRLELLGQPAAARGAGRDFTGTALSGGSVRGRLRIVSPPASCAAAQPGFVLACPAIDPGLTPLLLAASGLIVEQGGVLSHGAVLARQLGIPAVACPGIIGHLPPATWVVVDGDRGRITVES